MFFRKLTIFINMEEIVCTRCGYVKTLDEFNYKNKDLDIRKPHCKECDKLIRKNFYIEHKDRVYKSVLHRNKELTKRNRQFVWDYLLKHPCVDCGETNPIVLEFDHKDRVKKINSISRMVGSNNSLMKLQEEINKCDVRCANCHKIRTAKQFNWYCSIKTD